MQVDAVGDVKEDLLKLAWQVAVPHEPCVRGERSLIEADADHFVPVRCLVFPGSALSCQVPWPGQHGGMGRLAAAAKAKVSGSDCQNSGSSNLNCGSADRRDASHAS